MEKVAFPLTTLWNKWSIRAAQALVEKTKPIILSPQLSGPQVKGLVKWVSDGNDPESFGSTLAATPRLWGMGNPLKP